MYRFVLEDVDGTRIELVPAAERAPDLTGYAEVWAYRLLDGTERVLVVCKRPPDVIGPQDG